MKAEELRLGNLCSVYNKEYKTEKEYQIDIDDIVMLLTGRVIITPIKLTPSWLERMGFEIRQYLKIHPNMKKGGRWITHKSPNHTKKLKIPFLRFDSMCDIYYVHQLQNLVYALTGKEIEIKQLEKV